jgi:hypothetical protein
MIGVIIGAVMSEVPMSGVGSDEHPATNKAQAKEIRIAPF